jgi:hypothetical protein
MCHLSPKLVSKKVELEFWVVFFEMNSFHLCQNKIKQGLKMEKNLQAPQVLISAHAMKSIYSFSSCEGGVGRHQFWEALGLNKMP